MQQNIKLFNFFASKLCDLKASTMNALSKPNILDIIVVTYKTFITIINFKTGQSITSQHCSLHSKYTM